MLTFAYLLFIFIAWCYGSYFCWLSYVHFSSISDSFNYLLYLHYIHEFIYFVIYIGFCYSFYAFAVIVLLYYSCVQLFISIQFICYASLVSLCLLAACQCLLPIINYPPTLIRPPSSLNPRLAYCCVFIMFYCSLQQTLSMLHSCTVISP